MERRVRVLTSMTESEIRAMGARRWFRKTVWWWLAGAVVWLAAVFVPPAVNHHLVFNVIWAWTCISLIVLFMVCGVTFVALLFCAGRKFWNSVKDRPQPVEL